MLLEAIVNSGENDTRSLLLTEDEKEILNTKCDLENQRVVKADADRTRG